MNKKFQIICTSPDKRKEIFYLSEESESIEFIDTLRAMGYTDVDAKEIEVKKVFDLNRKTFLFV